MRVILLFLVFDQLITLARTTTKMRTVDKRNSEKLWEIMIITLKYDIRLQNIMEQSNFTLTEINFSLSLLFHLKELVTSM